MLKSLRFVKKFHQGPSTKNLLSQGISSLMVVFKKICFSMIFKSHGKIVIECVK